MNLDELVIRGREIELALPPQVLAEVADLTLRLHADMARRGGAILPVHMMRTYSERREVEQDGMRSAVRHVILALVLMGLIELPGS